MGEERNNQPVRQTCQAETERQLQKQKDSERKRMKF